MATATREEMRALAEKKAEERRAREARQRQQEAAQEQEQEDKPSFVNHVSFSCTLVKANEVLTFGKGGILVRGRVAVWQPPRNNEERPSMFFDATMWEPRDEDGPDAFVAFQGFSALDKGAKVILDGRLEMRMFEGKPYFSIIVQRWSAR